MSDSLALPHWTVAQALPSTGNQEVDRELRLRLQAIQENFEGLVSQAARQLEAALQQSTPPGVIEAYALATPPTGYLACDGAAVSRTTYADLFATIGTVWGTGDGSTTFNVPLYNDGRFTRANSSVGGTGGANAHTHGVTVSSVTVTGTTGINSAVATNIAGGGAAVVANQSHTHDFTGTGTGSGSADSQSNVPTYRDMFFIIKT